MIYVYRSKSLLPLHVMRVHHQGCQPIPHSRYHCSEVPWLQSMTYLPGFMLERAETLILTVTFCTQGELSVDVKTTETA